MVYIIYIELTALIEYFDYSIRVSRTFCKLGGRAQQTFGRPGVAFGYATYTV